MSIRNSAQVQTAQILEQQHARHPVEGCMVGSKDQPQTVDHLDCREANHRFPVQIQRRYKFVCCQLIHTAHL